MKIINMVFGASENYQHRRIQKENSNVKLCGIQWRPSTRDLMGSGGDYQRGTSWNLEETTNAGFHGIWRRLPTPGLHGIWRRPPTPELHVESGGDYQRRDFMKSGGDYQRGTS
ncbi:hypothetical protein QLX08_003124 [Tetragonisca angustula]|uniref:Uncharacterized protein n=1 Tax=Tetragonisca angustula TaxID=166442 RepID=A0AAW1A8D8_9HYME